MQHFKYPSINNLTEKDIINARSKGTIFSVSEKIHGANFSFCKSDNKMFCSSRNKILEPEDDFFGHSLVVDRYFNQFSVITQFLSHGYDIRLFGELAGAKVQNDVDYGDLDFYAFDLFVNFERVPSIALRQILIMAKAYPGEHIKIAPYLGFMDIDEVIKHGNKFDNLITGKSTCEGLILKDIHNVNNVFKFKNDLFSEVKIDTSKIKKYHSYNTANRIKNVISKNGAFSQDNMGLYISQIKEDITNDMKQDGLDVDFDGKENKYISSLVMNVYRRGY